MMHAKSCIQANGGGQSWPAEALYVPRPSPAQARSAGSHLSLVGGVGARESALAAGLEPDRHQLAIAPNDAVRREFRAFQNADVELVEIPKVGRFDLRSRSIDHRILYFEQAIRTDGETCVEGVRPSSLRDESGRLCLVPADHELSVWSVPKTSARLVHVLISPDIFDTARGSQPFAASFSAQVDVENPGLGTTLQKLAEVVRQPGPHSQLHGDALISLLAVELLCAQAGPESSRPNRLFCGGLAGWQERLAKDYVLSHLADEIRLEDLARLVRLSPFHFCRAFKQSFGLPPHRFQLACRVEQAKELLVGSRLPISEIASRLGFSGPGQFSTVFRKMTGTTPSSYRRR